jgi:hypothetical protein
MVVGEGAAPSRHVDLAFTGVYKTPPHGWCYPPLGRVVLWVQKAPAQIYAVIDSKIGPSANCLVMIPMQNAPI